MKESRRTFPPVILRMASATSSLGLLGIVYVRQSSAQQIRDHRESRERQYALVNLPMALGWPRDRILIIDVGTWAFRCFRPSSSRPSSSGPR
jgi:hypothetical protein